jgi:hypothetical protein
MALKKEEGAGWEKAKQTNERRVGRGESVRKVGCVVPVNRFSAEENVHVLVLNIIMYVKYITIFLFTTYVFMYMFMYMFMLIFMFMLHEHGHKHDHGDERGNRA